ncbi:MAG: cell division protein FtsQ/DivIB [Marmoricola sp.]
MPWSRRSASLTSRRRRRILGARLRILLAVVLVAAVVVAGGWLLYFSSYLTAQRVTVTGEHQTTAQRVLRVAKVPTGTPLVRLDLGAIRARVEGIPGVRSAQVSRAWPHTVDIEVTERHAVAVVARGRGPQGLQGVDASGVVFGHYRNRPPRLPLIRARAGVSAEALGQAARVAGSLPGSLAREVDSIRLDAHDQIRLQLRHGRVVLWGSAAHSDRKAKVAAVLLRRKVQQVNVTVPDRPSTRR